MAKNTVKGRSQTARFFALPHNVIASPKYQALSGNAVKLLTQIGEQYNQRNNGDLQATQKVLMDKGWKSPTTLQKAINELLESGFIIKTRQGKRPNTCSLFALTFRPIDEKPSYKYDANVDQYIGKTLNWWK
ncbi:Bacteriophage lambda Replication protein O N-terminal domain-containing protein [uncultured Thiomicrorhabdus sp.]